MSECPICCEKYNKSSNKIVTCYYDNCGFSACKSCTRTYLIGTTKDPNCMKCNQLWEQEFLIQNLNKTFCEKEYKNHRKDLLTEREISRLSESIEAAEKFKKIQKEEEKLKANNLKIKELNQIYRQLKNSNREIQINIIKIRNGTNDSNKEKRKFICPCPNEQCRGYLSTQYKCDLCEMFTCPHCLELIGIDKNSHHICNPDNVASAEMIKNDTKPCPQCGVRIHKTQGCDQMWCTQCKVAFSYKTLKIDNGVVHNPEYYRYMREQNHGNAPRNPGDVLCGGLCNYNILENIVKHSSDIYNQIIKAKSQEEFTYKILYNIHRTISHCTYLELPNIRQSIIDLEDTSKLRVYYILGEKDGKPYGKKELTNQVYANDKKRKKKSEILHIYELISVVGIEIFNSFADKHSSAFKNSSCENQLKFYKYIGDKIDEFKKLIHYCNNQLGKISINYNCTVNNIELEEFKVIHKKFKRSDLKGLI